MCRAAFPERCARNRAADTARDRGLPGRAESTPRCKLLDVTTKLKHLLFLLVIAGLPLASAQNPSRPDVPDQIKVPGSEELLLEAHASGFQIYTCQAGADGRPAWVLKAPDAELRDPEGKVIARHFAGPTWKHNDGSQVTGKAVARVDSPAADSIPWLLLTAAAHSGDGVFSRVTSIQRIHTQGGQPPPASACDASHPNDEIKRPYRADYYFYASK